MDSGGESLDILAESLNHESLLLGNNPDSPVHRRRNLIRSANENCSPKSKTHFEKKKKKSKWKREEEEESPGAGVAGGAEVADGGERELGGRRRGRSVEENRRRRRRRRSREIGGLSESETERSEGFERIRLPQFTHLLRGRF